MFLKHTSNGVPEYVNLALVREIRLQSDGTARFVLSLGSGDYVVVDFGSTRADAEAGVERLTHAIDAALYG